jgi:ArsR family transcriptional regulator
MSKRTDRYDFPRFFRAFSERARLRLLNLINDREVCLCQLARVTGLSESTAFRHLGIARRSGLVSVRQVNKNRFFKLVSPGDPHARELLRSVTSLMAEDHELRADLKALNEVLSDPASELACPPPHESAACSNGNLSHLSL